MLLHWPTLPVAFPCPCAFVPFPHLPERRLWLSPVLSQSFQRLFEANDVNKGGSFYLQSKVYRARESMLQQLQKDALAQPPGAAPAAAAAPTSTPPPPGTPSS